ncbi:MAG: hypothetical protein ACE5GL_11360 [Calditrichia bacterium]
MTNPDIIRAIQPIIYAFEKLSISYYISGSVASSLYGIARSTMDVDIVANIAKDHVSSLCEMLEDKYYIDQDMILDAIFRKASFNLIHLDTMIKIDIFIYKDELHQRVAFRRKIKYFLEENDQDTSFYFSSPEDLIINKLNWFKKSGEVSERQWLDVLGIIKVQGKILDKDYLKKWAAKLDLSDLLKKVFYEAGIHL